MAAPPPLPSPLGGRGGPAHARCASAPARPGAGGPVSAAGSGGPAGRHGEAAAEQRAVRRLQRPGCAGGAALRGGGAPGRGPGRGAGAAPSPPQGHGAGRERGSGAVGGSGRAEGCGGGSVPGTAGLPEPCRCPAAPAAGTRSIAVPQTASSTFFFLSFIKPVVPPSQISALV